MSDGLGDTPLVPFPSPDGFDFATVTSQTGQAWRVHTFALVSSGNDGIGWLQTAKSFESVDATLGSVRTQLFWSIPLVLALAALGGLFVADRGLRPIDRITRTAQTISGSVLNRRINHNGLDDEVGRLAKTFDAMLDRLEEAFERERRFTSDASHELRTPLTSLKGRIEVALNSPRTQPEYEETLHALAEEAERLIRLSSELLYLARLEQGEIPLQPEDVDLGNLLGAVIDQIRPLAESKNLTIFEDISPDLSLRGDPDHLIRLFLNITDNACKYTPSGGRITVRGRNTGQHVVVSISDTGPGIPKEHLPHLFERFYRVDTARSRDSGGTGLGLSIASEIAQIHGGAIEVQSEAGVGSTFTITLPCQSN
jgi:heavy metal sensor kinase